MKNEDPLCKHFPDNINTTVEIRVELHNMIHLNISEKMHCFLNQEDEVNQNIVTINDIVQRF